MIYIGFPSICVYCFIFTSAEAFALQNSADRQYQVINGLTLWFYEYDSRLDRLTFNYIIMRCFRHDPTLAQLVERRTVVVKT